MKTIQIDRSVPFDPVTFMGLGQEWTVDEQDEKSLLLTEIDLTKVILKTTLEKREKSIEGTNNLKRLKEDNSVRLDALVFKTLWENQHLIPSQWKEKINGKPTFIFFDGTVLRRSAGKSGVGVLFLCWYGKWHWGYRWLFNDWKANDLSAILCNLS